MNRKNKTKKEVVSDIQFVQDADRRRALIRDIIFPYLIEINETVGYSKIFLSAFSSIVNSAFDKVAKTTTIGSLESTLSDKLGDIFKGKDEDTAKEKKRYSDLINKLKDVSIQDLTYATELPRFIDGFILKGKDKESIKDIPIDVILG